MPTTLKAETLRALAEKATPGPWDVEDPMDHELWIVEAGKETYEWRPIAALPWPDERKDIPRKQVSANAALLTYLRNAVPEILALLEADKDEGAQYEAELQSAERACEVLTAENARLREALEYAHMGLGRIHVSLMANGPKQAAGEMTAHFLEKARRDLGKDQANG